MANKLSQSVVGALGKVVDDIPNFITEVEFKREHHFLILGRFKFYFVESKSFEESGSSHPTRSDFVIEIAYKDIKTVIYDARRTNLVQLKKTKQVKTI